MPFSPKRRFNFFNYLVRYGPAELCGTIFAYVGSFITYRRTGSEIWAAYGATIFEDIGFYGTVFVRDVRNDYKTAKKEGRSYGWRGVLYTVVRLIAEFGIAEFLDSLIVRPASIGIATHLLGRKLGVLIGKIIADFIFYFTCIFCRWITMRFQIYMSGKKANLN